ncbi:signal peptide-containing protein [Theileria equi strain WA]|uniref:Signal peptide-containing protein n=1 Tax=Theileria equi strain WA TaxID=1537102 RepID=L0AXW1_THEEQ|nr:signal peptide-containing protein [Theileria equi strain WA]AFZ79754.1 signal peptide-containing protein [Theileria equi strain WA]|eukprot:XP_004829420.1 signal peptide-containing protein [Theileria equi strain WA]
MKVLAVLLAVSLVRLCRCGDDDGAKGALKGAFTETPEGLSPAETTTAVTLDIASPNHTNLDVHTKDGGCFEYKLYLPKDTFRISSVSDGEEELWKAAGDKNCEVVISFRKEDHALVTVFLSGGNNDQSKYFEKISGAWKELKKEELDKKIEEMIKYITCQTHTEVPQDVSASIILDLASRQ